VPGEGLVELVEDERAFPRKEVAGAPKEVTSGWSHRGTAYRLDRLTEELERRGLVAWEPGLAEIERRAIQALERPGPDRRGRRSTTS
jgi:hypothetical protein